MAILGGLLCVIAIVISMTKQGRGIVLPIVALLLCGLSGLVSISVTSAVASDVSKALEEAEQRNFGTNQQPLNPQVSTDDWASTETPVTQDHISISVTGVRVGQVALQNEITAEESISEDDFILISINLMNTASNKKSEYKTWNGEDFAFTRDYAALTDNHGNIYKRVSFGITENIVGAIDTATLYPGEAITDVLVFERPVANFEYLELELPSSNFGGSGMVRFRIFSPMISY